MLKKEVAKSQSKLKDALEEVKFVEVCKLVAFHFAVICRVSFIPKFVFLYTESNIYP